MATEEQTTPKKEVPVSLESIASSVATVRTMAAGLYDHMNTLLERTSEIYDVINDRLATEAAGYGTHYADYLRDETE